MTRMSRIVAVVPAILAVSCGGSSTGPDTVKGKYRMELSASPPADSTLTPGTSYSITIVPYNDEQLPPNAQLLAFVRDDGAYLNEMCGYTTGSSGHWSGMTLNETLALGKGLYAFANGHRVDLTWLVASRPPEIYENNRTPPLEPCDPLVMYADRSNPSAGLAIFPERADIYRTDLRLNWAISPAH